MEVLREKVSKAYTNWRTGMDLGPDEMVPNGIHFDLEELTPENSYAVTPMHEFFMKNTERLGYVCSQGANISLLRSWAAPIFKIASQGGVLTINSWEEKDVNDNPENIGRIFYNRYLFETGYHLNFDVLELGDKEYHPDRRLWELTQIETREGRLKKLIEIVKGRPIGERISLKVGELEMELQEGIVATFGRDVGNYLEVNATETTQIPGSPAESQNKKIKLDFDNRNDVLTKAQEILANYLAQF